MSRSPAATAWRCYTGPCSDAVDLSGLDIDHQARRVGEHESSVAGRLRKPQAPLGLAFEVLQLPNREPRGLGDKKTSEAAGLRKPQAPLGLAFEVLQLPYLDQRWVSIGDIRRP